ncbi:hypothetical protein ACU63X_01740 [Klebsiella aerogenes]|uniref:hypothetical protein n=2 Tax=Enterobacteriaceae TaxID=543 RepID=UPI001C8CBB99|nr:hypothetical protein [Klebsiella aerogenes]EKZ2441578.1 hypothetical protein [Citrobacter freundii]MBX9064439.1 hypothetical protein [Klebsiella aerogenes]MDS1902545.1 hypothetical protein [Klebsiella aerogenes]MDS1932263.1 hypothetical protein [Klebsiella aerogenes]MDS2020082.1 hypothetical protein [Klebsiella aerogenes]
MGSELASGLLGALVGGLFTLLGTLIEGRRQKRALEEEARSKQRSVLIGIRTEIITLIDLYKSRMSDSIDNYDGSEPFSNIFPLSQNYFSFYDTNSLSLASINEEALKSIVMFYGSAKGLVDTYKMNNDVVDELSKLQTIFHETNMDIHKFNWEQTYHIAIDYGKSLKDIHNEVMSRVQVCLENIESEVIALG